jgi:hypothetical protein
MGSFPQFRAAFAPARASALLNGYRLTNAK